MVTRRYGADPGAAGVVVSEQTSANQLSVPSVGTAAIGGPLRRGPMGEFIPIRSKKSYSAIFGDPSDINWHLFPDSSSLAPDAIDGFFAAGNQSGTLMVLRLDLDGTAKRASRTFLGRNGIPVLNIKAANAGRWAGRKREIAATPIIYATSRTITISAPGVLVNEFKDATISFPHNPALSFIVTSNTKADPNSGEVVLTVGSQYNLISSGISGPASLAGTAAYSRTVTLTGTATFDKTESLTGTININNRTLTGTGTSFLSELSVGSVVYYLGEARTVESITSDTTLVITSAFTVASATAADVTTDSFALTGTLTTFLTDFAVGDEIYANVNGTMQAREIASIESDTALTLTSGFTESFVASAISRPNLTVTGTTTAFTTDVTAGQYLIDPNRSGNSVKVVSIESATSLTIDKPFTGDFTAAQLTKQSYSAEISLQEEEGAGLSIELTPGETKPETHFTITVYFNDKFVNRIADCSLDPEDPDFVEDKVLYSNLAFSSEESGDHAIWIEAENLWNSLYTTGEGDDVRPCNGAATTLAVEENSIYTVEDIDYSLLPGSKFYPDPYGLYRKSYTISGAMAPVAVEGTIASTGVEVYGASTQFTDHSVGDYLYDPNTETVRKIRVIYSDIRLDVESAFSTNIPALTEAKIAGTISVSERYDLAGEMEAGDQYILVFPQKLEGGYDGPTNEILPFYYTKFFDTEINALGRALEGFNLGVCRLAFPGISDVTIQKAGAEYVSTLPGEYRCEIPSYIVSEDAAESFVIKELGRNDFESVAFPSYGYISNPFGRGERLISCSGDILGGESRKAVSVDGYHDPFSGTSAVLARITRLTTSVTKKGEAALNSSGIQLLKRINGNIVVWGGRCPSQSATYTFLHVRRIQSHYILVLSSARNLADMIFVPNQPGTLDVLRLMLSDFAIREYTKGAITQYLSFEEAVSIGADSGQTDSGTAEGARASLVSIINGRAGISFSYVPTGIVEVLDISVGPNILVGQYGRSTAG
jgi:hypothetical protein